MTNSRAVTAAASSTPSTAKPVSSDSVERLFAEFELLYGSRLADLWRGTDVRGVKENWRSKLAGMSVGEVRRGVAACLARPWPPTLPEFLQLCRPPTDAEAMFAEAQCQVSRRAFGDDHWPCKALYWAAVEFTFADLRALAWPNARARWTRILTAKLAHEHELADVPRPVPALPAPGQALTDVHTARMRLQAIKALLKNNPTNTSNT
ncbi:hypothetical protein [Duganella sp. HH101]|uniref:hypothetical protein n=1 Tax=Duganella sp. HH101 TaxID=1781066 RepID=UPI001E36B194|nr:hypothetical protein [Duganella sp. HH101]